MKVEINDQDLGGLMYISLAEGEISGTEEVAPGVILDHTEDGQVVGIEVLYLDRTGAREAPDLALTAYPDQHGEEKKAGWHSDHGSPDR